MTKIIDNDFHPDDKGLNATQEDHWGTEISTGEDPESERENRKANNYNQLHNHSARSALGAAARARKNAE